MLYLFQVIIYSALLYAIYLLVLKDRATHSFNRFYLLLCATLPPLVPFIKLPGIAASSPVSPEMLNVLLPQITIFTHSAGTTVTHYTWSYFIVVAYTVTALAILLRTIIGYIAFRRFVRQFPLREIDGVKVLLNTHTGPGSFQQYVLLPGADIDAAIMAHELAHIRLRHSVDILLLRLLQAAFWPNLVLYAITKELKIIHEFQADACAAQNKDTYIHTLLNDTFGTSRFFLSHTFFFHPLKRRIMMLQKSPLSRKKLRRSMLQTAALTTLLLSGIVYLQSCSHADNTSAANTPKTTTAVTDTATERKLMQYGHKVMADTPVMDHGLLIYPYVKNMPSPTYDLNKYIQDNIKYPASARKNKIEGRVIVRFTVDADGKVINPIVLRGVNADLDAEAIRVVASLPAWTPGENDGKKVAVYFTMPLSFQLG